MRCGSVGRLLIEATLNFSYDWKERREKAKVSITLAFGTVCYKEIW